MDREVEVHQEGHAFQANTGEDSNEERRGNKVLEGTRKMKTELGK